MGTDISGFIECREPRWGRAEPGAWRATVDLDLLYDDRDYDAFGCLFGVRNYASFRPLAAGRGLPDDLSDTVRQEVEGWGYHDATWISWAEVAAVDWDEPATGPDQRMHEYRRRPDGALEYVGKSQWSRRLAEVAGISMGDALADRVRLTEGQEFTDGDTVFRAESLLRRHAAPPDGAWRPVWKIMETLADRAGPDGVRLVVWFDS